MSNYAYFEYSHSLQLTAIVYHGHSRISPHTKHVRTLFCPAHPNRVSFIRTPLTKAKYTALSLTHYGTREDLKGFALTDYFGAKPHCIERADTHATCGSGADAPMPRQCWENHHHCVAAAHCPRIVRHSVCPMMRARPMRTYK